LQNCLKLIGQFENAKIKVQSAKLWNPNSVGMADFHYGFVLHNWLNGWGWRP